MLFVADAMRRGDDHEVDLEASEGWYRRAASLGSGRAMYGLGLIHLARHEIESATEAFETAGERGCGAALWVLGLLHRQGGEGVSPDMDKARAFLKRGSALGHVWSTRSLAVLLMGGRYGLWARLKGYALYAAGFLVVSVAIIRGKSDPVMR